MEIVRGRTTFRVNPGQYDFFWNKLAAGTWEPATLAVFDRFIDSSTTVLDIGAWIGPTTLYAARRAKRVIAFEPDPIAYQSLVANLEANPDIDNVEVHQACIAAHDGSITLGIDDRPGDSESSILFGNVGPGWTVPSARLGRIITESRVERPLFIKMDIEGYEFELIPEIQDVLRVPGTIMHLSTHPNAFGDQEARAGSNKLGRRLRKHLLGRSRAVKAYLRLAEALSGRIFVYDERGEEVRLRSRLLRIACGAGPTASDALVISADPLTW